MIERYPHQYVVLAVADVTDRMISDCVQSRRSSVRRSTDGTLAIVKYRGGKPASIGVRDSIGHAAALALMQTAAWQERS